MLFTSIALATALSTYVLAKDCQGKETAVGAQELQYTVNPSVAVFYSDQYVPELLKNLKEGGFDIHSITSTKARVNYILNSTCTMNIEAHSADKVSAAEMAKLFTASLQDTDLL
jgi:hypothetical protein